MRDDSVQSYRPATQWHSARQLDDNAIRSHYVRARLLKEAAQASRRMIAYLRHKLNDDKALDIRQRKINGKRYWCIIRWVHPKLALGALAKGVYNLLELPVIVLKIATDDDEPRDVTYRDLDHVVRIEKDLWQRQVDAFVDEFKQNEKDTKTIGREYAHEVKAAYPPKSYLAAAYMNQAYWDAQRTGTS